MPAAAIRRMRKQPQQTMVIEPPTMHSPVQAETHMHVGPVKSLVEMDCYPK